MVPVEWPLAATAADPPVEPARARGSQRLASVRRDFFLDPTHRLSEQERALMTGMLHDLVESVTVELLAVVPGAKGNDAEAGERVAQLRQSGLLDREDLVSLLLRRADEHRIAIMFAGRAGARKLPLLPHLVADQNAAVAAAAMVLVVARGRRRDAFGQPRIELDDLSSREACHLVYAVAAALAESGAGGRRDLATAADSVAARHAASNALDSALSGLCDALAAAGRNDDAMIEAAAEDGEVSLIAGLLARRAAISVDTSWGYLVGGQDGGLGLLGRLAGLGRPTAARLIAEYASLSGASVEEEIGRFDSLADSDVEDALGWWRLPAVFRMASVTLAGRHG